MSETSRPTLKPTPWGMIAVVVSLGFLVGGILWPGNAESLLRLLLTALALGWTAARALGIDLPTATMYDSYSPFDGGLADSSPPSVPYVVRRRARVLAAVDDPDGGTLRPIPWPVARGLIHEAARRLESGHGLRLSCPTDHIRIRPLVSEVTWTLLGLGAPTSTHPAGDTKKRVVPLARLDDILDDLERL
ncbi:MAG: hypothetical protein JRI25_13875 [Deltaproteobacteria bacterium]|nr:hypothetical protein [Deltaproteobacteria bacterium]